MSVIETERLILREFTMDDAPFTFRLLNTAAWLQFIGDREIRTTDDARNYILNGLMQSYKKFGIKTHCSYNHGRQY